MPSSAEVSADRLVATTRTMATDVTITVSSPGTSSGASAVEAAALEAALEVFHVVEKACTRFDPASPLMQANRSPRRWHRVPPVLFEVLTEASHAHDRTAGRFDPRVIGDLVALGYDRSLGFARGDVTRSRVPPSGEVRCQGSWRPRLKKASGEVLLGSPVDLGGIGKGLAVRWAAERLARVTSSYLVEAGGDCYCAGKAPDATTWQVGIEDPAGGDEPIAVLGLKDRAVTTSSTRLRRWRADGELVHHLIDPGTGRPGGDGLAAVTVVGDDPADSEVWAKVLFLAGWRGIGPLARRRSIPALWVDTGGSATVSPQMERYLLWRR